MIKSTTELYSILKVSDGEVKYILQNIHNNYTQHIQPKIKYGEFQFDKSGAIRLRFLMIPSDSLKLLQKKINDLLQQITLPDFMYGSVPGKNHILNASQHLTQTHFLTIDIKNFFPNINHQHVFKLFVKYGLSPSVARLLTKLTTYKKSLPQGAPSSPVIANLVFLDTARKLATLSKYHNLTFTCFLDDLSFSSQHPFKHLVPFVLDIIKKGGFYPSPNKIHYKIGKCEITGLIVNQNKLNVIPVMRKHAETNFNLQAYVRSIDKFNAKQPGME